MDETLAEIEARIAELRSRVGAVCVFVITPVGHLLAAGGNVDDTTVLADAVRARLDRAGMSVDLLERGWDFDEPDAGLNLHVGLIGRRVILTVIYGAGASTGLVRLGARETARALEPVLRSDPRFREIEDDDLDDLF